MIRRPPRSTRTDTRFPYTTLFRSYSGSRFRMVDNGRRAIFRGESGGLYQIRSYMERDWTLVPTPRSAPSVGAGAAPRSEEHTSELQSLMRISYAVFCLKKKKNERTPP